MMLIIITCLLFFNKAFCCYPQGVVIVKVKKLSYPNTDNKNNKDDPFITVAIGIVIKGHVVTNSSLIGEATHVSILSSNNEEYEGVVVARDLESDLAIIKSRKVFPDFLGNDKQAIQGMMIVVVGCPYNLLNSVMHSVVVCERKSSELTSIKNYYGNISREMNVNVIQYQCSVASPLYGALLFDMLDGGFVGITTPVYDSVGMDGFKFAVPATIVRKVVDDLILYGYVKTPYIGITVQNFDYKKLSKVYRLDTFPEIVELKKKCKSDNLGCFISKIDASGVKLLVVEDIILAINGTPVVSKDVLLELVSKLPIGKDCTFLVFRKTKNKDEIKKIVFKVDEIKNKIDHQVARSGYIKIDFIRLTITDKVSRANYSVDKAIDYGLIVKNTECADYKLQKGDVILTVQGKPVKTIEEFDGIIAEALKNDEKYLILFVARQKERFLRSIDIEQIKKGK